jgi:hypothetical protein
MAQDEAAIRSILADHARALADHARAHFDKNVDRISTTVSAGVFRSGCYVNAWRVGGSKSSIRITAMKTNAFRIAGGVALLALGAPLPAFAQFSYPMIIVPPPLQNYVLPKPAPKAPPEKSKSAGKPADALNPGDVNQCYQGRTKVCP